MSRWRLLINNELISGVIIGAGWGFFFFNDLQVNTGEKQNTDSGGEKSSQNIHVGIKINKHICIDIIFVWYM